MPGSSGIIGGILDGIGGSSLEESDSSNGYTQS